MGQTNSDPGAVGARGAVESLAERQRLPLTTPTRKAPELHRQRLAAALYTLGPRATHELLDELRRAHPQIGDDIDRRLQRYANRLNPKMLRAVGGDQSPPAPLRAVGGGQ